MADFALSPDFAQLVGRSSDMRAALQQVADEAARTARDMASTEAHRTGAYEAGIVGAVVGDAKGNLVGQIQATDWKSRFLELGTVHNAPHAIVRRAGESVGPVKTGGDA